MDGCLEKIVMDGRVDGHRWKGRPMASWMDSVKRVTGMTAEQLHEVTLERTRWRGIIIEVTRRRLPPWWNSHTALTVPCPPPDTHNRVARIYSSVLCPCILSLIMGCGMFTLARKFEFSLEIITKSKFPHRQSGLVSFYRVFVFDGFFSQI